MAVITNLTVSPINLLDLDEAVPAGGFIVVDGTASSVLNFPAVLAYVNAGKLSVADDTVLSVQPVNTAVLELAEQASSIRDALAANTLPINFNNVSFSNISALGNTVYINSIGGTQDNATALNAAISTYAGKAKIVLLPGTWQINSPIALTDGTWIEWMPGSTVVANIAGSTVSSSIFVSTVPGTSNATTLSATPSAGSNQISLTSAAGYSTGCWLEISVTSSGIAQYYHVDNLSGTLATLDRDVSIWPFSSGDTVRLLAGPPPRFFMDGNWLSVTGTAVLALFAPGARDSKVCRLRGSAFTGANVDAFAGFHTGAFDCVLEDIYVDLYGAGATINAGNGFVGTERCTGRRCFAFNGATAVAWKFSDTRYCDLIDSGGSGCQTGVAFGTDFGITIDTNVGSRLIGGFYSKNSGPGIVMSGCTNCTVDVDAVNDNGAQGIYLAGSNTINNTISITAKRNGTGQISVSTGAKGTLFTKAVVESVAANTSADVLLSEEATFNDLRMTCKATTGAFLIFNGPASTTTAIIRNARALFQTAGSGNYGFQCLQGNLIIEAADALLGTNGTVAVSTQAATATIKCKASKLAATGGATGTYGFYAHGGVIHADIDCDVTGVANDGLIDSGGTLLRDISGTGAPTAIASVGSRFARLDGGAGTSLYIKESGTTGSGWVAK